MDTQPHGPLQTPARRRARWGGAVLGVAALSAFLPATAAHAVVEAGEVSATTRTQPAVPAAEAWFRPALTCDLPIGCLPITVPSGYPDGTLHVGVLAGQEESRTYIALRLPASGIRGGTLQLPVAAATDGTAQASSAKIRACLVTGTVTDKVAGDMTRPPTPDCSVSSPANAKGAGDSTVLSVDLAPFASEWSDSDVGALALLPAEAPAPTDTWHVAFSRHDRTGAGVRPLSATVLVAELGAPSSPTTDASNSENPVAPAPVLPGTTVDQPVTSGVAPGPVVSQPLTPAPTVSRPDQLVPAALQSADTSFAFPGVFLLPPLVLIAAAWVARAFTRDLSDVQQ